MRGVAITGILVLGEYSNEADASSSIRSTLEDFFPVFWRGGGGGKEKSKMSEDSEIKHSTVSLSRDFTGFENYPISFHSNKVFSGLLGTGG